MSNQEQAKSASPVPVEGVLLGIDYGTKRIGVAISTPEQRLSVPLTTRQRETPQQDADWLKGLVKENRVVGLVVGLPVHMSGDEGTKAREAREFGIWAGRVAGLPVTYWDERYTTSIADAFLGQTNFSEAKREQRRDRVAANLMLQSFLEAPDRNVLPADIRGT